MNQLSWISVFGGLAFFFYGLEKAREGLQLVAGDRMKILMGKLAHNRFFGLGLGTVLTIILQSSSATTVILVSFAEVGLMNLTQAFGVILGSGIGTTFVVILLSFKKITDFALLFIAIGIVVERLSKNQTFRYSGSIAMGFGMIFFGMHLMTAAVSPLRDSPIAASIFEFLALHPYLNLIFAALFTGVIQASAATIGLAIALSFSGALSFEAAIPIVLGANIGTCMTAILSSIGMTTPGRRVAATHVLIKTLGVILVMPFLDHVASWVEYVNQWITHQTVLVSISTSSKIALTHLLFNIALAIFFLPLITPGVWLVQKLLPDKPNKEKLFGPKYLDEAALSTPPLAFAQAMHEIMRVAKIAKELLANVFDLFKPEANYDAAIAVTLSTDDKIDRLEKAVRFYLAAISQKVLSESQARRQIALTTIGGELEDIGDLVSKDIIHLARKKRQKMTRFSQEGWEELKRMHKMTMHTFDLTLTMLMRPHPDISQQILAYHQNINEVFQELQASHLHRLHDKLPESYETSSIHLELLSHFRNISSKLTRIAQISNELMDRK